MTIPSAPARPGVEPVGAKPERRGLGLRAVRHRPVLAKRRRVARADPVYGVAAYLPLAKNRIRRGAAGPALPWHGARPRAAPIPADRTGWHAPAHMVRTSGLMRPARSQVQTQACRMMAVERKPVVRGVLSTRVCLYSTDQSLDSPVRTLLRGVGAHLLRYRAGSDSIVNCQYSVTL